VVWSGGEVRPKDAPDSLYVATSEGVRRLKPPLLPVPSDPPGAPPSLTRHAFLAIGSGIASSTPFCSTSPPCFANPRFQSAICWQTPSIVVNAPR
jgi:hypothetical protein